MKHLLTLVLILLSGFFLYSQTQSKMNETENDKLIKSEKRMATVLKQINVLYADSPVFLKKLRISQNCWKKFRDAHMDAIYPAADKQALQEYGSVFPMAYAMEKRRLTEQRIKELSVWINGVPEGTVGAGSVKFTSQLKAERNKLQ